MQSHLNAHNNRMLRGKENLQLFSTENISNFITEAQVWAQMNEQALAVGNCPADKSGLGIPVCCGEE